MLLSTCVLVPRRGACCTQAGASPQPGAAQRAGWCGDTGPLAAPLPGRCWRQGSHERSHGPTALGTEGSRHSTSAGSLPGHGMQDGHHWGRGEGGGSALLSVVRVAAIALLFEAETPNVGALAPRLSCCGFVASPTRRGGPGAPAPAELGAASHLLLPRGQP